jgi:hypothetical protein
MAGAFSLGKESIEKDPWLCTMHVLHVGVCTEALPCCTEEYGQVRGTVEELLEEDSGGCICEFVCPLSVVNDEVINWSSSFTDISGVPRMGKMANVHAIVRELKCMAEQNICFICCDRWSTSHTRCKRRVEMMQHLF